MAIQDYVRNTNSSNIFTAEVLVDLSKLEADATEVDLTDALPKGKLILGGGLTNLKDDLGGGTTTYQLTVGSTSLAAATATAALKGKALVKFLANGAVLPADTDKVLVKIVAGDSAPAGSLVANIIYM